MIHSSFVPSSKWFHSKSQISRKRSIPRARIESSEGKPKFWTSFTTEKNVKKVNIFSIITENKPEQWNSFCIGLFTHFFMITVFRGNPSFRNKVKFTLFSYFVAISTLFCTDKEFVVAYVLHDLLFFGLGILKRTEFRLGINNKKN